MDENEEFEFRARAEREAAPTPRPPPLERQQPRGFMDSTLLNNPLVGAGELGLQALTSIPSSIVKGLTGAVGMLRNGRAGMQQTAADIAAVPGAYEPRTDSAKAVNKGLGAVGEAIQKVALGRALQKDYKDPLALATLGGQANPNESPQTAETIGTGMALLPSALAAIPMGKALVSGAANNALTRHFSPSVQAGNVIRNVAGTAEQRAAQAAALRAAAPLDTGATVVPNSGPTAAQALVNTPEGTTLQGLQQAVAQRPDKGISVDYARRLAQQQEAIDAAKAHVNEVTAPLREQALSGATAINHGALNADIADIMAGPGQAVSTTRNFLGGVQHDIAHAQNASELYAIRKRINDLLSSKLESDQVSVRGSTVELGHMKKAIDKAITDGGGTDWQTYLDTYSSKMKPITDAEKATKEMYSPAQPTAVSGEAQMPGGQIAPHIFSRAASLTNYGLGLRRAVMGKSVNRHIANAGLDPTALADILDNKPPAGFSGAPTFAALVAARLKQQDQEQQ